MNKCRFILLLMLLLARPLLAEESISVPSDPFSDIQDLDTSEEEEAIERFYSFGRFIHLEAFVGIYMPSGSLANIYTTGLGGGGRLNYFIDWDIAITFQVSIGMIPIDVLNITATNSVVESFTGTSTMFSAGGGFKYYFNFYDISKAIAYINPAINIGFGVIVLSDSYDSDPIYNTGDLGTYNPDTQGVAPELYAGLSFEFPLFKKDIYLGFEATYHYAFFNSERDIDLTNTTAKAYFGDLDYTGSFIFIGAQLIWNLN